VSARVVSMDNINRWLREVAEHPHLAELYYRGIHDFESLQNGDLVGFSMLMDQIFYIYQEMYYRQLEGHLDPLLWGMTEVPMRDINGYPGVQAWWRSRSHWFLEDFAKHVNRYSSQPRLQGCFANQWKMNELSKRRYGATVPYAPFRSPPAQR
jgi:hypothetical protein